MQIKPGGISLQETNYEAAGMHTAAGLTPRLLRASQSLAHYIQMAASRDTSSCCLHRDALMTISFLKGIYDRLDQQYSYYN